MTRWRDRFGIIRGRKEAELAARALGFRDVAEAVREYAGHRRGTRGAIEFGLASIDHLASFRLVISPGLVVVMLRMPWWAWLTFGWLHRRVLRRAWAVMHREVVASVNIDVGFEVRR